VTSQMTFRDFQGPRLFSGLEEEEQEIYCA